MPEYRYRCEGCTHELDAKQSMHDDALVECPQCHQPKLQRIIFVPLMVKVGGARTLGVQAELNTRRMIRDGTFPEKPKQLRPWWRPHRDQPNMRILNDPVKYIEDGAKEEL